MMLQDHFHPPLSVYRHWHSFHNAWATYLASQLNEKLPEGYYAESNVHFGVEIDVAAMNDGTTEQPVLPLHWMPPDPGQSIPMLFNDSLVEINIFNRSSGPTLAAAIELVSPSNKDRPASREAFLVKCMACLQQGIGLMIVDVVTNRSNSFHDELLTRFGTPASAVKPDLFAASYRPIERAGQPQLDIWYEVLQVGNSLPTLPLWLPGDLCLPLDLHAAYERTCREHRLSTSA